MPADRQNALPNDRLTGQTQNLINLGNFLFFPAGLLLAVSYGVHPPGPYLPALVSSSFWIAIHAGFLLSLLGGIFSAFSALTTYLRKPNSRLQGPIGACMAVVGLFLIGGLDYAEIFIFPTLAIEFPAVVETYGAGDTMPSVAFAFPAAGIFTVIGYFLLSYELYRTRCIPSWAGVLTMVSVVIFGIGLSGFFPFILAQVGAILFGLGLMSLGWGLLPRRTVP